MTVLNQSIPYTMRIEAEKTGYVATSLDYFVGGIPNLDKVELG